MSREPGRRARVGWVTASCVRLLGWMGACVRGGGLHIYGVVTCQSSMCVRAWVQACAPSIPFRTPGRTTEGEGLRFPCMQCLHALLIDHPALLPYIDCRQVPVVIYLPSTMKFCQADAPLKHPPQYIGPPDGGTVMQTNPPNTRNETVNGKIVGNKRANFIGGA